MKDQSMRLFYSLSLAVLLVFSSGAALAQGGPRGQERHGGHGMPGHEQGMDQRLNSVRMFKLVELLNLDEEKAAKLAVMMKKHREKIMPLMTKFKDIEDRLRAETENEKQDAKELNKLISSYRDTANNIHKEREDNTEQVLSILTPEQKGKYLLFQESFPREFKEKMREFMKRNIDKFKKNTKRPGNKVKEDPKADETESD